MAYFTGPNIVKDGLIFALDAGSSRCFTSGDTTATDLVQGFNCSGANGNPMSGTHTPDTANFPVYNATKGGVFDFADGKGINVDGDLGNHNTSSMSMWLYRAPGNTQYVTDARNDGGQWFLSNYSSYNLNWHSTLEYNFETPYNASAPEFINKWVHMTVTSNSSGSKIYINGIEKTATGTASADEDFGINFRIGTRYTTSPTSQWTGKMGSIYLYDKVLSAAEVLQNFNAQKSRFL